MSTLKDHIRLINISLPLLKRFRFGDCCESVRKKFLAIAINDFLKDIGVNVSKKLVEQDPYKYYNEIRKLILKDTSLTSEEKIDLISKM
mgnify:FL=1